MPSWASGPIGDHHSIFQIIRMEVYDGGASGVPGSSDATLFEDQGVFVP
jgi:hypothetical protein